jgi:hypothetical protein
MSDYAREMVTPEGWPRQLWLEGRLNGYLEDF